MKLCKEILIDLLKEENVTVTFPESFDPAKMVEGVCYQALRKIKLILEDDHLEDEDCFMRIEEIVCEFERLGSGCGVRHDPEWEPE